MVILSFGVYVHLNSWVTNYIRMVFSLSLALYFALFGFSNISSGLLFFLFHTNTNQLFALSTFKGHTLNAQTNNIWNEMTRTNPHNRYTHAGMYSCMWAMNIPDFQMDTRIPSWFYLRAFLD